MSFNIKQPIQSPAILLRSMGLLDQVGLWVGLLSLRLLLGWEFFEAGLEKFSGDNWFADIQSQFPFPFNHVAPATSWELATWFELVGALALVAGFATRFFSVSLVVLTVVAMLTVHWPASWSSLHDLLQGYVVTDKGFGNFKLPVMYLGMLLPLLLMGPGRLSADAWVRSWMRAEPSGRPSTVAV